MISKNLKPISVYIHIPFCIQKCNYCDFVSFPIGAGKSNLENYQKKIEAYCNILNGEIIQFPGKEYILKSIFIGGGTPSVIDITYLKQIVATLYKSFPYLDRQLEFSIEVNPATIDCDKLQSYQSMGINRISIGLQATEDRLLNRLGRIHTFQDFLLNYKLVRELGYNNINIDLMSGIPGLTLNDWKKTLETVIQLNPEHISAYSLIIEENTPIHKQFITNQLRLPDEDTERQMYYLTKEMLEKSGYHRYEISNYAKKEYECKHNKVYWQLGEYIGFGIAAASYVNKTRYKNSDSMEDYLSGKHRIEEIKQSKKDEMEEYMFLGLRMTEGVNKKAFAHRFHESVDCIYRNVINELLNYNLIINTEQELMLTNRGIDVSNTVFEKFLL